MGIWSRGGRIRLGRFWFGAMAVALWAGTGIAATLQVPQEYETIQAAIAASVDGDEVLVAPGLYIESLDLQGKQITIRGQVGPDFTLIEPINAVTGLLTAGVGTTLDTVIEGFSLRFSQVTAVTINSGGMTFRHCRFLGNLGIDGGAVRATSSQLLFEDCEFINNNTPSRGGTLWISGGTTTVLRCLFDGSLSTGTQGGAIWAENVALGVTECVFTNCSVDHATNVSSVGGAIWSSGGALSIFGSDFSDTRVLGAAAAEGGAIYRSGAIALDNCSFSTTRAESCCTNPVARGGGIRLVSSSESSIVNATFSAATTNGEGGGLYVEGGLIELREVTMTACTAAGGGGAIRSVNAGSFILNSEFSQCSSSASNLPGGALRLRGLGMISESSFTQCSSGGPGGAVSLESGSSIEILRTIFSQCFATRGGAIACLDRSSPLVLECIFEEASAGVQGGGVWSDNSAPSIVECLFRDCASPPNAGSAIFGTSAFLYLRPTVAASLLCGCVPGGVWYDFGGNVSGADLCNTDCTGNGYPDAFELIAGWEEDCNNNQVPDSCDIEISTSSDVNGDGVPDECDIDCNANGTPDGVELQNGTAIDLNHDGVLDECQELQYKGLRLDLVSVAALSPGLPTNARVYRVAVRFASSEAAVLAVFGEPSRPWSFASKSGFVQDPDAGPLSTDVDCSKGDNGDSWLTIGLECDDGSVLQTAGLDFAAFEAGENLESLDGVMFVDPGSSQSIAGDDRLVLVAQLTTIGGEPPSGTINLLGLNSSGTEWVAYGQSLPEPTLVDCDEDGIHDVLNLASGDARDCDGSGVLDECEYPSVTADCDGDGEPDYCELLAGTAVDADGDGVPDDCECLGDFNGNGAIDAQDVLTLLVVWGPAAPGAREDLNADGVVNALDLLQLLNDFGGCP